MAITVLSSKGQIIIPKSVRDAHQMEPGQKLEVLDTAEGILLKPARPYPPATLSEVAACLKYDGPAKSLKEMDEAIRKGAMESANDRG
ncbi:MAG: AbrB/MazE/SpoVT family DNA-binding domain-containing protein [Desulfurivibrio sp.]|nr:MAG: AbrB/MazE/SpoVT family DNA-binding domain-containing protein [Desulfurivibrio sp.]